MKRETSGKFFTALLAVAALVAACGPGIEYETVAEFPPVPEGRDVVFTQERPDCEHDKVGDLRVKASDWPAARSEVEKTVRGMGGDAVVGWESRRVTVRQGGGGSDVPGASSARAHRVAYFFGVVVRLGEGCEVA